jgi:hypothetical protein
VLTDKSLHFRNGLVFRPVIDNDEFAFESIRQRRQENPLQQQGNELLFVIKRDEDGERAWRVQVAIVRNISKLLQM